MTTLDCWSSSAPSRGTEKGLTSSLALSKDTKLDTSALRTYLASLDNETRPRGAHDRILLGPPQKMRRVTDIQRFDPPDRMVGEAGVGVCASYVFGRRVPALISVRREADT